MWIVLILGSGLFFALNHLFRKKILEDSNILDMMILTGGAGFFFVLPLIKFVDFSIPASLLFLIMLNAAFAYGGSLLLNIAYKHCEISTISPLLNLSPLFVILLSYSILGEILNSKQLLGVFFILIGGYIVTLEDIKYFIKPFTAIPKKFFVIVFATLILWSICPVINKFVLMDINTITYLFFFTMFIFFIQVGLLFSKHRFRSVTALARRKWPLLLIAGFCWVLSDLLHLATLAIPATVVSLVIPVKRISNLLIIIIGGTLFQEKNLIIKSSACAAMLAGLFVIGLYSRQ